MTDRKTILWLVSWYPNKYDVFDGDFIQRHAKAAALFDDIHVLFVKPSEEQRAVEKVYKEEPGITEQIIYMPKHKGIRSKIHNYRRWQKLYKKEVSLLVETRRPLIIHVHIPWKVGLIARWASRKFKIPYIVTEHWGIYNKFVDDNIFAKSFITRYLLRRIFKEAIAVTSVSRYLGEGINTSLLHKSYTVIPNVVDTKLFFQTEDKYPCFTFIHVSNMVPLKNVDGILQAFYSLLETGANAQLILIGNRNNVYEQLAGQMGIPNAAIFFKGEIAYSEVAKEMQRSHVFILNSHIENSPCVIGEALCCGLPVIATTVGGIPELINDTNAICIPPESAESLTAAMASAYQKAKGFNAKNIAVEAMLKFSPDKIGAQFHTLYYQV